MNSASIGGTRLTGRSTSRSAVAHAPDAKVSMNNAASIRRKSCTYCKGLTTGGPSAIVPRLFRILVRLPLGDRFDPSLLMFLSMDCTAPTAS